MTDSKVMLFKVDDMNILLNGNQLYVVNDNDQFHNSLFPGLSSTNTPLSDEEIISLMKNELSNVDYVHMELLLCALILNLNNHSDELIDFLLEYDPTMIEGLDAPTLSQQLKVVRLDGMCLGYIHNPSSQVIIEAIKENGLAIGYVKREYVTEDMKALALENNPESIIFFQDVEDGYYKRKKYLRLDRRLEYVV